MPLFSADQARAFVAGDGGRELSNRLMNGMVPIYWHAPSADGQRHILNNGSLTLVRSSMGLFGITAHHVVEGYFAAKDSDPRVICQIGNLQFEPEVIARSGSRDNTYDNDGQHDLCTLRITEKQLSEMQKLPWDLVYPPEVQEGRGMMFGGFPGNLREDMGQQTAMFGGVRVLGVARRVSDTQITWVPDRDHPEHSVQVDGLPDLPPNADMGGISGGPLVGFYETPSGFFYWQLAGIVVQAESTLENVVARRIHLIRQDGSIRIR